MRSEWISDSDLESIVKLLSPCDKVLTRLLTETGFRIDDVMHLRRWQLFREQLTVKEMKTGKVRTVSISTELIRQYRRAFSSVPRRGWMLSYAFPSLRGGGRAKMHRTTFWRHFVEAANRAGFKDRAFTPHSLRKVYAVRLRKASGLDAVQKSLGHDHITTTMLYAFSDELRST